MLGEQANDARRPFAPAAMNEISSDAAVAKFGIRAHVGDRAPAKAFCL
jgi:hypothetical protein